jgi:hypothetical protein
MTKTFFIVVMLLSFYTKSAGQTIAYDSITISRFLIRNDLYQARWNDSLKAGSFQHYLSNEKSIWIKPAKPEKLVPKLFSLFNRIKANGTADIAMCFIPRHSINFYKAGKIERYLLVCFECDGVHFSDDPVKPFIKSVAARDKQLAELKVIFKELIPTRRVF